MQLSSLFYRHGSPKEVNEAYAVKVKAAGVAARSLITCKRKCIKILPIRNQSDNFPQDRKNATTLCHKTLFIKASSYLLLFSSGMRSIASRILACLLNKIYDKKNEQYATKKLGKYFYINTKKPLLYTLVARRLATNESWRLQCRH